MPSATRPAESRNALAATALGRRRRNAAVDALRCVSPSRLLSTACIERFAPSRTKGNEWNLTRKGVDARQIVAPYARDPIERSLLSRSSSGSTSADHRMQAVPAGHSRRGAGPRELRAMVRSRATRRLIVDLASEGACPAGSPWLPRDGARWSSQEPVPVRSSVEWRQPYCLLHSPPSRPEAGQAASRNGRTASIGESREPPSREAMKAQRDRDAMASALCDVHPSPAHSGFAL
jgi:hypothetical protein